MIDKQVSKNELLFLLFISQSQDEFGIVHSVYYKNICSNLKISIQKFYDVLRSLSEKKLISYRKNNPADYEVTLTGNSFEDGSFKNGYINVAEKNFFTERFMKLKAGSMLLYLYSQRFVEGKHMLITNFYNEFSRIFHIRHKTLQLYLQELKDNNYLFISRKRNNANHYEMTMRRSSNLNRKETEVPREKEGFLNNVKDMILVNFKRHINDLKDGKALDDIISFLETKRAKGRKDFPDLIIKSIKDSFILQKREERKDIQLNAALVNKYLTYHINGSYALV